MNRKIKFYLSIAVCFLGAVFLSNAAQVLDRVRHPLVSSLTCIETGDPSDLYWNINQIELRGGINQEDHSAWISLSNNIPNFESYYFRVDGNGQWQQTKDGRINLGAGEGAHTLELKASTDGLPVAPGKYIRLSIRDHGSGIPKENLSRIFDPYFTTKEMGARKGMGLGLSVCHSIIEKHDGCITVESEEGKGTTFCVYLPASEQ